MTTLLHQLCLNKDSKVKLTWKLIFKMINTNNSELRKWIHNLFSSSSTKKSLTDHNNSIEMSNLRTMRWENHPSLQTQAGKSCSHNWLQIHNHTTILKVTKLKQCSQKSQLFRNKTTFNSDRSRNLRKSIKIGPNYLNTVNITRMNPSNTTVRTTMSPSVASV